MVTQTETTRENLMADFNINVSQLTQEVFGIKGFVAKTEGTVNPELKFAGGLETIEVAEQSATSIFGTAIFETLSIKIPNSTQVLDFEDAPLMTINMSKNIVLSHVQKRKGTVKEYINDGDYIIQIKGLLVNHDGEDLPYNKIAELNNVIVIDQELEVESRLLNLLGVHNIVVSNIQYRPSPMTNVQPYVISCFSDEPIELSL